MWKILVFLTNITGPSLVWYIWLCEAISKIQEIFNIKMNGVAAKAIVEAGLARFKMERQCLGKVDDVKEVIDLLASSDLRNADNAALYKEVRLQALKVRRKSSEDYNELENQWQTLLELLLDIDNDSRDIGSIPEDSDITEDLDEETNDEESKEDNSEFNILLDDEILGS